MKKIGLGEVIAIIANVGVLVGLAFVAYEVRQNTSELRSEGARSITESVNAINAGIYADPGLRSFIREYEDAYVGSQDLLSRLIGDDQQRD